MAKEIRPPHVFANFRPTITERKKKRASAQARREGNSEKHLACIRQLPCIACWAPGPNDPHHLKGSVAASERGVGMKATDRWAVPLCRRCHDDVESFGSRRELGWFQGVGVEDPYTAAVALWAATGDLATMEKIERAHQPRRSR